MFSSSCSVRPIAGAFACRICRTSSIHTSYVRILCAAAFKVLHGCQLVVS